MTTHLEQRRQVGKIGLRVGRVESPFSVCRRCTRLDRLIVGQTEEKGLLPPLAVLVAKSIVVVRSWPLTHIDFRLRFDFLALSPGKPLAYGRTRVDS